MRQSLTTPRRMPAALFQKLIGKRYVLAWALSVLAVSLHPALAPTLPVPMGVPGLAGEGNALHVWAMGVTAITAVLGTLWLIEPYIRYRYRRRRFRRVLLAENAWSLCTLHRPPRPWSPLTPPAWWRRLPWTLGRPARSAPTRRSRPARPGIHTAPMS